MFPKRDARGIFISLHLNNFFPLNFPPNALRLKSEKEVRTSIYEIIFILVLVREQGAQNVCFSIYLHENANTFSGICNINLSADKLEWTWYSDGRDDKYFR